MTTIQPHAFAGGNSFTDYPQRPATAGLFFCPIPQTLNPLGRFLCVPGHIQTRTKARTSAHFMGYVPILPQPPPRHNPLHPPQACLRFVPASATALVRAGTVKRAPARHGLQDRYDRPQAPIFDMVSHHHSSKKRAAWPRVAGAGKREWGAPWIEFFGQSRAKVV